MQAFSWCQEGIHEQCHREYERYYIDPKTNKVVWLGETRKCICSKRGCPCYVPKKDQPKTKVRRRKK